MSGSVTYVFDPKDPSDIDGLSVETKYWLGPDDSLSGTPAATASPAGLTINSVAVSGTVVTVWVSGGSAGTTYTVRLNLVTLSGRNVFRSFQVAVQAR